VPLGGGIAPRPTEPPLSAPWNAPADGVLRTLKVDPTRGLSVAEAERRLAQYGPNRLREHRRRPTWHILLDQFRSLIIALLGAATAAAFYFGETLEAWAILVVIALSVGIGFVTELRAVRSMEALFALGRVTTRVRRDGHTVEVSADAVVPGDVVVIEAGDVITADLRLVEASKLQADESALTGESVPVAKDTDPVPTEAPLAERTSMLYKGTAVTRGAGLGVATGTGMATELGAISALVEEAEHTATPLEKRLNRLGRTLIGVTLAVAAFVAGSGILAGKDLFLMVETGIALAVAAVPEGLPVVATIALARGVRRMAQRNALLRRLSSVETLGSTGVILTDKTGTLTENRMTVTHLVVDAGAVEVTGEGLEIVGDFVRDGAPIAPAEDDSVRTLVEVGVLCNDADLEPGPGDKATRATGDPMEVALLVLGAKAGLDRPTLLARQPEVREEAFDPDVKMMATVHDAEAGSYRVAVKGGPGAVLRACSHELRDGREIELTEEARRAWLERNRALARDGMRVLAVATKTVADPAAEPYEGLRFVGLVGLEDPPRDGVREALAACHSAGIDVVMVTGDQPATALGIARDVGLVPEDADADAVTGAELADFDLSSPADRQRALDVPVFARVNPKQKLDLIALHQGAGRVVAMTGDGVNDAPALKKADIGIAMGQRGTQVAREAADMVLQDDAFATIVAAVRQGRVIFGNIRRFVFYLLSCNVSEVMVVGLASALGMLLPLLPLQILFLNLVTDVFPALALGMGEGDEDVMRHRPRDPREPILSRRHWGGIALYGLVITSTVLGALWVAQAHLGLGAEGAVTVSFLTLAFAQLWHVFNMRRPGSGFFSNEITRNPYVWGALALCTLILLGAAYVPGLATVLRVATPGAAEWTLILGASLVPLLAGELYRRLSARF
jgi:Ca2+-transporting ATPase